MMRRISNGYNFFRIYYLDSNWEFRILLVFFVVFNGYLCGTFIFSYLFKGLNVDQ